MCPHPSSHVMLSLPCIVLLIKLPKPFIHSSSEPLTPSSWGHTHSHKHSNWGQFGVTNQPLVHAFGFGRKPEHPKPIPESFLILHMNMLTIRIIIFMYNEDVLFSGIHYTRICYMRVVTMTSGDTRCNTLRPHSDLVFPSESQLGRS